MRALLYLRQSDTQGEGDRSLSLDSQASILRADADKYGWTVVAEIRDADLRGYDTTRPGLLELYQRCRAGEIDLVAFWKLDRLARLLRLQENVLHELAQLGVEVFSHEDPQIGVPLFRQILGAFAEEQTRIIAANVRRALREKQRRGLHVGNVAWGYIRPEPAAPLIIDPEPAAEVTRIFAQRLSGIGPAAIARDLQARGIPTPLGSESWRVASVSRVLRCPTYRGAIAVGDRFVEDAHDAIIDPDTWHRAQQAHSTRHRSPRENKHVRSWLDGHVEHSCGYPMYLIQGRSGRSAFFRCRVAYGGATVVGQPPCDARPRRILVSKLEPEAWGVIAESLTHIITVEQCIARVRQQFKDGYPGAAQARREAEARAERARSRRQRAEDLYLSGARDRAWFDAEDARLTAELATIAADLARLPKEPDEAGLRNAWVEMQTLRDVAGKVTSANDRADVLRELGAIVVGDGPIRLKPHPELAWFFAPALLRSR